MQEALEAFPTVCDILPTIRQRAKTEKSVLSLLLQCIENDIIVAAIPGLRSLGVKLVAPINDAWIFTMDDASDTAVVFAKGPDVVRAAAEKVGVRVNVKMKHVYDGGPGD